MSKIGDLKGMGGSFQNSTDREKMMTEIQQGSANFQNVVERHNEKEQMSLRDITKAASSGELTPKQRKELGLSEEVTDTSGDLLSDFDVLGAGKRSVTPEDIKREEHEAHAQQEQEEEEEKEEKEEFTFLEDGTKICNTCGTVVNSPSFVDISDEDLIEYFMGGRIVMQFDIGPISVLLRSLNESELDYCGELMARDVANDEFPTEIEYQNRFSFYRLVFALVGFGRKGKVDKLTDPSAQKGRDKMEEMFAEKARKVKGYGHTLRVRINQKQQILENSIAKEVGNEDRLKNF